MLLFRWIFMLLVLIAGLAFFAVLFVGRMV